MDANSGRTDVIGMISAGLCAVHCIALPILIGISASLHWVHELTFVFLLIGGVAAYSSTRQTSKSIMLTIWSAYGLLCLTAIMEHGFQIESQLHYLAAAILIFGHYYNWKRVHYRPAVTNN